MSRVFAKKGKEFILAILALILLAGFILPIDSPAVLSRAAGGQRLNSQPADSPRYAVKGKLLPKQWVSLSFPDSGRVAEILVKEGDVVASGAHLASLGDPHKYMSSIAQAELELLSARQAYGDLFKQSGEDLALAELRLAEARKVQSNTSWKVKRMSSPPEQRRIEQAYANMLLARQAVEKTRQDLRDAEKLWNDHENIIWRFVPHGKFKLRLLLLQKKIALAEVKYSDAIEKHTDLLKPVDEIDLELAEADLALADANVQQAIQDRDALLKGPDPDDVILAEARIRAAQEAIRAAQAAYAGTRLNAPLAGQVFSIPAKANQWTRRGQQVMVLADISGWTLEIEDVQETEIPSIQVGQKAQVAFDALPGDEFSGSVQSISLLHGEKDGDVTYTVRISFSENDPRLRWGMTARITFIP